MGKRIFAMMRSTLGNKINSELVFINLSLIGWNRFLNSIVYFCEVKD